MRIKVIFESEKIFSLNKDYRRYFISFLKKVFEEANLKEIYQRKEYKPFTFSVWLGKNFKIDEELNVSKEISFLFSSGDPVIITNFYNGVIKLKKENFKIIREKLRIKDINLLSYKKINRDRAIFKTIGVCVLNNPEASKNDFKRWYIIPTDDIEKFNEILFKRTNERYQFLIKKSDTHRIRFNLIEDYPIKEIIVKHYKGYVRGFKGIFELKGSPEILQFIYDYGFGVRTGQGFGLLEIVKEL
uniref:CRISPR-associated endoribonuclease Cas6 n=1 Tax=Thermodesulfobacterium geofontis TaxID=1295609 RepID=A0A7V6CD73_9BACT